jgi:hypothetical protein
MARARNHIEIGSKQLSQALPVFDRQQAAVGTPNHRHRAANVMSSASNPLVVGSFPHQPGLGCLFYPQGSCRLDVAGEGIDVGGINRLGQIAERVGRRLEEQVGHRVVRAQAKRSNKKKAGQKIAAVDGQIECHPAAKTRTDNEWLVEFELTDQIDVVKRHIRHVGEPRGHVAAIKTGVDGGDHGEVLGQEIVDGAPS